MLETEVQEHRRAPRSELDIRVHIRDMAGEEVLLLSHDWSENSVFLRTHKPLPLGSLVSGYVVIPDPPTKAEIGGVVVRVLKPEDVLEHCPPGMVIRLNVFPLSLREYVETASRSQAILAKPIEGSLTPVVMISGMEHSQRREIGTAFEVAGYEVVEADHDDAVLSLIHHDLLPDVIIAIGDEPLDLLLRRIENASGERLPQLAILVGPPPRIVRRLRYPLVVVPSLSHARALPPVVRLMVHARQTVFVIDSDQGSASEAEPSATIAEDASEVRDAQPSVKEALQEALQLEPNGDDVRIEGPALGSVPRGAESSTNP